MIFQATTRAPVEPTISTARPRLQRKSSGGGLAINQPNDRFEQEAEQMAERVLRAAAVGPASRAPNDSLRREEHEKKPPAPDNYGEAAKKVGDALQETTAGKQLKAKAEELGQEFLSSVEGKVIAGSVLGGTLTSLIATNSELPVPLPEVPLDFIKPGLKAKITYEGPMQKPTNVGLTLTSQSGVSLSAGYTKTTATPGKPSEEKAGVALSIPLGGSAPKKKSAPSDSEKIGAETAQLQAEQTKLREAMKTPAEKKADEDFMKSYLRFKANDPLNPVVPPKKKEDSLLMRSAAGGGHGPATAPPIVDEVLSAGGQPLDRQTRSFMEARFGHDFGRVRIHADARAAESARAVNAHAYTVGAHIAFAPGRFAPTTADGRRLLAHELAHTIQQRDARGALSSADSRGSASSPQVQRKPDSDARWKTSVDAARDRGQLMAARVQRHGKLSADARAKMNEELAYFEGAAKDAYTREIKPVLVVFVGIEMPEMDLRPAPAKPAPTKQESEYEGMAAYYASTRQSQLDAAQAAHAKFRQGVHNLTRRQIDDQWDDEKENFLAVVASADHGLSAEQFFEIWKLHWGDKWKAARAKLLGSKDVKPENRLAAEEQAEAEEGKAAFMLRAVPLVQEFLIAVEDQDKHLTLDEVNDAALQLEGFHENMVAASGMFVPGGGLSGKPGGAPRVGPAIEASEVPSGGGGGGGGGRSGPPRSDTLVGNPPPMPEQVAPPARPPAKTIEASPPPPPQAARPGGPTPVTDVEVVKANVNSPGSIQPRSPAAHQNDWNASGGRGTAPGAFRDGQGNIHVSSDHPLMGSPGKGGIPPVSPGAPASPARPPAAPPPAPAHVPARSAPNIGLDDTGQAPAPPAAKPAVNPSAKTPAAPAPPSPPAKAVAPGADTGAAAPESQRPVAQRGQIDPPQPISAKVVENMRNRPATAGAPQKGRGSNVNYTTDHAAHQQAWQRLGGHGDSPPAFIYDNQVYLDPSRWPPK